VNSTYRGACARLSYPARARIHDSRDGPADLHCPRHRPERLDDWLLFQFRLPQLAVFDEVDALRAVLLNLELS